MFYFALALIALDFFLRLIVVEKYTALRYIRAGTKIRGFEAPGYVEASDDESSMDADTIVAPATPTDKPIANEKSVESIESEVEKSAKQVISEGFKQGCSALGKLFTSPRTLTLMYVSLLNGIVIGALLGQSSSSSVTTSS